MNKPGLLADIDPDFICFRPQLRDVLRSAETECRTIIENGFRALPDHLQELLAPVPHEVTASFLRSHLEFYRMLNLLWPLAVAEKARLAELERSAMGPVE